MIPSPDNKLVLGIHPTSRGYGWALLGGPNLILDWGIASAKARRSARSLTRFKRLLAKYHPHAVVFEEFEGCVARRAARIQALSRAMIREARLKKSGAFVYSRAEVRAEFPGATTRYEIAQGVAERLPPLRRRMPPVRKPWMSEDERQCIFDAAALALTHYAVNTH